MTRRAGLALSLTEPAPPPRLPPPAGLPPPTARVGADELALPARPAGPRPFPSSPPTPGARFAGLNAIHACYAPEPTTEGWLRGVLAALRPLAPSTRWFGWADGSGGEAHVIRLEGEVAVSADTAGPTVLDAL